MWFSGRACGPLSVASLMISHGRLFVGFVWSSVLAF